jgi:hypothetical protein
MKNGKQVEKKAVNMFNKDNLDLFVDKDSSINDNSSNEREIYQEEKDKIEEWKREEKLQNEKLLEVGKGIKIMGQNAKMIGNMIDTNQKMIEKTITQADNTDKGIKQSNKQLKEIMDKVGGPTNFCVDVILVIVCLGLIMVLYNLIKGGDK